TRDWSSDVCSSDLTASSARSTSPVMWNRSDILNPANPEPMTSQHSDRCLGTWTGGPGSVTSGSSNANVERRDSLIFRNLCGRCGRLHRRVWGPLQSISLHMLTPRATRNRFCTSQVGDVNHGVVEA